MKTTPDGVTQPAIITLLDIEESFRTITGRQPSRDELRLAFEAIALGTISMADLHEFLWSLPDSKQAESWPSFLFMGRN